MTANPEDITSTITELYRANCVGFEIVTGKVAVTETGDWIQTGLSAIRYADATADTESTAAQTACTISGGQITFVQATAATVRFIAFGFN